MANVNIVVLAGNLTRDPEMRYTPGGTAVAKLGMAVNRKWKDQQSGQFREETTFVDVDCFGRQAETASQYLSKGRPVMIEGRLKLDQWEDKTSGQKRSKLHVIANRIHFLGGSPGGAAAGGGGVPQRAGKPTGRPTAPAAQGEAPQEAPPEDLDIPEDDIPF